VNRDHSHIRIKAINTANSKLNMVYMLDAMKAVKVATMFFGGFTHVTNRVGVLWRVPLYNIS
jgi:hypothetical protein